MKRQLITFTLFFFCVIGHAQNELPMNTRSAVYEGLIDYSMDNQSLSYFEEPINSGFINTKISDDGKYITYGYKMAGTDRLLVTRNISKNSISQIILIITPEVKDNGNIQLNTYTSLVNHFNSLYDVKQVSRTWNYGKLNLEIQLKDDGIAILTLY